jgi:cephalosporin-C deacetylase
MAYGIPDDFDAFWEEARAEAAAAPIDVSRRATSYQPLPTHSVELIEFQASESRLQGWIATPRSSVRHGFLWIPAYGRESHLPDEYSTREGMLSLSFNFHGHAAFHKEEYRPDRGYFAEGVEDPRTWVFRRMAKDCLIAMSVLTELSNAAGVPISAAGLSQGGGMAIWTGAHSSIPMKVVADLPFLSDMGNTLGKDVYRYPLKELANRAEHLTGGMEQILNTVSYFDTAHQARRLTKPTLVSLGEKDPAVKPESVRAVFSALAAADKRLIEYPTGHDWNPGMIDANREFLLGV